MKLFDRQTARLTWILFAFSAAVALLLSLVNVITRDRIDVAVRRKTEAAMHSVLSAESYQELNAPDSDSRILAVYRAGEAGYVVQCRVVGSQDTIDMVVGVDTNHVVTGIGITQHAETSGLGANAAADTELGLRFRTQYQGRSGFLSVKPDGGDIDVLTGATVTSRAVTEGVNAALAVVAALDGEEGNG